MSYVDDTLVVCICVQRNFLIFTFMSKCILKLLWQIYFLKVFFMNQFANWFLLFLHLLFFHDINDHIQNYIISCKIFSQQKVTVSKDNMNLWLRLSLYSSHLFINEAISISEKNSECRFGALLEISDIFSSKLNFVSYIVLQCCLN